jgi:hypothetical protein
MATISDTDVYWALFKCFSIVSSPLILLLALAWMVARRWPSK